MRSAIAGVPHAPSPNGSRDSRSTIRRRRSAEVDRRRGADREQHPEVADVAFDQYDDRCDDTDCDDYEPRDLGHEYGGILAAGGEYGADPRAGTRLSRRALD